jgi:hypothetical protein
LDDQELALFTDLHLTAQAAVRTADSLSGTATALTGTATAATATLGEGKRTIAAAQPLLEAFTQDGKDLDSRINDPHVTALVAHLAGMSSSGDLMLADAQWKTHQLLHPDRIKLGFWGGTWAGIQAVHKLEPPLF